MTYDEVNDLLPPDIVSSDQIDDLMMMFGEMDIEVVDAAHKVKVGKQREEIERLPVEEEMELEAEGLGKAIDPVYMYLREMGSVSLLTREGEVEIAKRIENGRKGSHQRGPEFPLDHQGDHPVWGAAAFEESEDQGAGPGPGGRGIFPGRGIQRSANSLAHRPD